MSAIRPQKWRDCVVTYVDVIGIKEAARQGGSRASRLMLTLRDVAQTAITDMRNHDSMYCWNDSVLLLAFWNKKKTTAVRIMREISGLKRRIDVEVGKSYAICVKGKAFPVAQSSVPNCTILKTSSFAMGNCFSVETEAKRKKLKDDWYIDSWFKSAVGNSSSRPFSVRMLPTFKPRKILRFTGYF